MTTAASQPPLALYPGGKNHARMYRAVGMTLDQARDWDELVNTPTHLAKRKFTAGQAITLHVAGHTPDQVLAFPKTLTADKIIACLLAGITAADRTRAIRKINKWWRAAPKENRGYYGSDDTAPDRITDLLPDLFENGGTLDEFEAHFVHGTIRDWSLLTTCLEHHIPAAYATVRWPQAERKARQSTYGRRVNASTLLVSYWRAAIRDYADGNASLAFDVIHHVGMNGNSAKHILLATKGVPLRRIPAFTAAGITADDLDTDPALVNAPDDALAALAAFRAASTTDLALASA